MDEKALHVSRQIGLGITNSPACDDADRLCPQERAACASQVGDFTSGRRLVNLAVIRRQVGRQIGGGVTFTPESMRIDIDCKQMVRLVSDSLDRAMSPAERVRMRLHLVTCESCRNVDEQMGFLRRTMRQLGREQVSQAGSPANDPTAPPDQTSE